MLGESFLADLGWGIETEADLDYSYLTSLLIGLCFLIGYDYLRNVASACISI